MEDHHLDLERLMEEEDELLERDLVVEENKYDELYGLEFLDRYRLDEVKNEVQGAMETLVETPDERPEEIRTVNGFRVIRIHDQSPEIIEEPKRKRWHHGPRYR
ncbi:MAG: hypothetical protein SWQ30_16365 [Thermodesulfobacteriota bacterium]|nr:hypothetical protein [Thermodesulfobacteriota bacterium]